MGQSRVCRFTVGDWSVDPACGRISCGGQTRTLRPKEMALLACLAERQGEVVSQNEIIDAVWDGLAVSDDALYFSLSQLRKALGDDRRAPAYIETISKRGYRLIPPVRRSTDAPSRSVRGGRPVLMVGRDKERATLRRALDLANSGEGQILLVTGEPGIGKTTLVEIFLDIVAAEHPACQIGRGRCSERLAGTGAYLPLLEVLETLCNGPAGVAIRHALEENAPGWCGQIFPHACAPVPSQERLKRELVAFFQDIGSTGPVVLFFDDLHWADASTIDLLAYLAAHFGTIRLLIVVTYRSSEMLLARHPFVPLKLDLQGRGRCRELALDFLTRADVDAWLAQKFAGHRFSESFGAFIHEKSAGNALFMVDLLRHLQDRGVVAPEEDGWVLAEAIPALERDLPESIRGVISRKIDQLDPDERRLLTVASVCGYEFLSAVVAEAADVAVADAEECLDYLDRVHVLVFRLREQDLPDGSCCVRYRFTHVLYHDVLLESLLPGRKAELCAAIAAALEARYGERRAEIAPQLALLLAMARDFGRAADTFLTAAERALRVQASHEARALSRRGLAMLDRLPPGPPRDARELPLQMTLGLSTVAAEGWAATGVAEAYRRALTLCGEADDRVQLFPVLSGLWLYHQIRAEMPAAKDLAARLLRLAEADGEPTLLAYAHLSMAAVLMDIGRPGAALDHAERAAAAYERETNWRSDLFVLDAGVVIPAITARTLWTLGYPDRALAHAETALSRGRACGQPHALAFSLTYAASVSHLRGDVDRTLDHAEESAELCRGHGLVQMLAWARLWRGWALRQRGHSGRGVAEMQEGLGTYCAIGSEIARPQFLGVIAEAMGEEGRPGEGLALIDEASSAVRDIGEHYYEPEIHRLRGRLLAMQSHDRAAEGERSIRRALGIARDRGARGWELRAAIELYALPMRGRGALEARSVLEETVRRFTEGFDTQDIRTARDLVAAAAPAGAYPLKSG